MNPPQSNRKDANFFRLIRIEGGKYTVEVGYWITYSGCRPKYQKKIQTFDLSK
jgi:hypothetical protein